jgi:sec-independent protein translocase protein TatA
MAGIVSPTHLLVVLLVAVIVLGSRRLPGAARALGHGLREFKDSLTGSTVDTHPELAAAPVPPAERL